MTALLAFLSAFPAFVSLVQSVWNYLLKVSNGDPATYIAKIGPAFSQLNNAKTDEDYQNAAKALADAIASLPKPSI